MMLKTDQGQTVKGRGSRMIAVVDDDESIRAGTRALFRSAGYDVETFASAELFLDSGVLPETGCLVLDVRMPGIGGLELQRQLNSTKETVPIIFVSAHDDIVSRRTALEAGALDFFCKPFDAAVLVALIGTVVKTRQESPQETMGLPVICAHPEDRD